MQKNYASTQDKVLFYIKEAVEKKLAMKKSIRKKLKRRLEEVLQKIQLILFPLSKKIKQYDGKSRFGCDKFGRDVEDGLDKYIRILKSRNLCIHTVVVLGSRAKGSWNSNSDVDVTIIASNLPNGGRNPITKRLYSLRRKLILSDRPLNLGIEPSGCCSREEFLKKLRSLDLQALDAVIYGQVIYDDGFWNIVRSEYEKIKRKFGLDNLPLKKLLFPV